MFDSLTSSVMGLRALLVQNVINSGSPSQSEIATAMGQLTRAMAGL